jgi:hypothetical protein
VGPSTNSANLPSTALALSRLPTRFSFNISSEPIKLSTGTAQAHTGDPINAPKAHRTPVYLG